MKTKQSKQNWFGGRKMVNKKWSINILLCGECDEDISNITNIFDKLYIDENNKASFDIVTIANAIGCDEKKFGLYYYIERLTNTVNQIAFAGSTLYYKDEDDEKEEVTENFVSTIEGAAFKTNRMRISSCEFPGLGKYEIKVYKYDNEDAEEIDEDRADEFCADDHLVALYPFKVERK